MNWLQENNMCEPKVELKSVEREGHLLDTVVAKQNLEAGELALQIPEGMCVTLNRVFQDETVAELLTDNKLSELACLTLYMMYEKKQGKSSFWYEYIKELDRQRGRGQMGAKSPLLWDEGQVQTFLKGSPVVKQIQQRIQGIQREYQALDTVWFMAGSLFKNYPYDVPTETFKPELFQQAFAALQASVVHLQGVPLANRFALVPLGPPMLAYSSTCKAMLAYNPQTKSVELRTDRPIAAGEAVPAWCGPQPNSRMLINYGIVEENNPFDKLQLMVTLPSNDPLFRAKRTVLSEAGLSSQQAFDMQRTQALPSQLLPYMRVCLSDKELSWAQATAGPVSPEAEALACAQLISYLDTRLAGYPTSIEEDSATIESSSAIPRQKVAARLVRIEKQLLQAARLQLQQHADAHGITLDRSPLPLLVQLS